MATAAFNDVSAWILLALIVALARNGDSDEHKSPLLVIGVAFVAFMLIVIRPIMKWVDYRCSLEHDVVDEAYI
ncbi:Na_H_Exchanger domain-containing protein [Cephalotus follicularis]|uniref:Na_H_Exchanger domain-containing protein n=1 Tax=Cephalotus follicularis TaxID=3775 RepID=A0A1Q3DE19_CEPFO|nr:Na_H_Exchanger domain-containing protein [Cephalotus follicularis]